MLRFTFKTLPIKPFWNSYLSFIFHISILPQKRISEGEKMSLIVFFYSLPFTLVGNDAVIKNNFTKVPGHNRK